MQNGPAHPPGRDSNRHLPALSLLLVVAAGVLLLWHFFPSPHRKRMSAFAKSLRLVDKHYVRDVDEQDLFEAAMRGMMESLEDPHSLYLDRTDLKRTAEQTRGEFGGIGVVIAPREGRALIIKVMPERPAERAGVQPGDLIVRVDGMDATDVSYEELVNRIRGEVGTEVSITFQRSATGKEETLPITRGLIVLDTVSWRVIEPGIGYVEVKQFDNHSLDNVRKALRELESEGALDGLIIDLRGNTGGLLRQAVEMSDMFLVEGVIVRLESRLLKEAETFGATEQTAVSSDVALAILVDWHTASAAEVFAGALQNHGRATVIGTNTFGKGAVNRVYSLPGGSGLVLTVAHYTVGPDAVVIHGRGVEPDVKVGELPPPPTGKDLKEVEAWLAQYQAAQEEQLERAVQFIKDKAE